MFHMERDLETYALAFYRELKTLTASMLRAGWRPLVGWAGVFMMFGIAYRIANGLPLPNVADICGAIIPTMGIAILRTLEKNTDIRIAFPQTGAMGPGAAEGTA